nr:transposase (putative), gypsy type [Tanacetum cinerariifolium]
ERVFPTAVDWRTNASKDGMPANGTYSVEDVRALDTHRTPIQKQPEMLLCMVGISRRYYLGDEVYPTFRYDDDREIDLFSLIRAPNPTKVKTGSRPRAPHELPLLTLTAPRVIKMDEPAVAADSSGVPSTIERSPLDFAHEAEASGRETAAPEMPPPDDVPITTAPGTDQAVKTIAVEPPAVRESRKRGHEGIDANAPSKSLRRDHADLRPSGSSRGGKSLAAMQFCLASNVFVSEGVPADVSDPDPLAFADALSPHPADVAQSSQGVAIVGDPKSENVSSPAEVGSPGSVYRPEWGVTNGSLLDTPEACQDLVDHAAPRVAMGSQLRLRFEQEAKLLRKSVAQVARRDQRIQARESEIKNLEALLETEAGMKRAAEEKSAGLSQELERMRAQFSELQVSNERLSQQVDALQRQVSGEETLKAAFKDYKRRQDQMVEQRPQAFADVVSAGVAKGMSEGLKHGVEHGHAQLTVESLEAYDPEAEAKFAAELQSLKDLKYPLLDQLEGLKDAPMDLALPMYPEVRDPRNPWAFKEEIKLSDAIAANISRAEKKKKCRIVCGTHGVGSAHHARSDGISVSVPTVVPQGLAL